MRGIDQTFFYVNRGAGSGFFLFKLQNIILKALSLIQRDIERGMSSDRVRHRLAAPVKHAVKSHQGRSLRPINDLQFKIKRILLLGQLIRTQRKYRFRLRMGEKGKFAAASHSMLRHFVDASVDDRAALAQCAHHWKKHRGTAAPPLRIPLPHVFPAIRVFQAFQLRAHVGNLRPALFCPNDDPFFHTNSSFSILGFV